MGLEVVLQEAIALGTQFNHLLGSMINGKEPIFNSSLPTVILLHGYSACRFTLKGISDFLHAEGYNPIVINYPFWRDLSEVSEKLAEYIDTLVEKLDCRVSVIGHSQGGLIGFDISQQHPNVIDCAIALGAPFQGTTTAYIHYPIPSCQQMIPGSRYLQNLLDRGFPQQVQFFSIFTPHDLIIRPWDSAVLPQQENVHNVPVNNIGHLGLISDKCYTILQNILQRTSYHLSL